MQVDVDPVLARNELFIAQIALHTRLPTENQKNITLVPAWPMTSPATSSTDMPCTCTPIGQCACCARGPECGATTSLLACSARFKQTFARPARHPRRGGCRRARCRRTRTTPSLRQGPSRCTVPCDHALHISAADRQRRRPSAQPHLRVRRIRRTTSTRARTFRSLEHEAHAREVLVHGGEGA